MKAVYNGLLIVVAVALFIFTLPVVTPLWLIGQVGFYFGIDMEA